MIIAITKWGKALGDGGLPVAEMLIECAAENCRGANDLPSLELPDDGDNNEIGGWFTIRISRRSHE